MTRSDRLAGLRDAPVVRSSIALVFWQGLSMAGSLALTALIARGLSVSDFGVYRYALTFLTLGSTLLQVGVPYSIARLLALHSDDLKRRQLVGLGVLSILATTCLGIVAIFTVREIGFGTFEGKIDLLLWTSPALLVTLGQLLVTNACQGAGRIGLLSLSQVVPFAVLLPATALQIFVMKSYSLEAALAGYFLTFVFVLGASILSLGYTTRVDPVLRRELRAELGRTGIPIYVGGVFGVATAQFVAMWTAAYVSDDDYGHYALALGLASPLGVLISSIGTVIFRHSTDWNRLPASVVMLTGGLATVLLVTFLAASQWLLVPVFGSKFAPSIPITQWLAIGAVAIGCGDVLQRYLGARGMGRSLGAASILTGVVATTSAALLLPEHLTYGAVASAVLGSLTYLAALSALYILRTRADA